MPRWTWTAEERFWAKVDQNGPLNQDSTRCWLWTAGTATGGHGRFWLAGRMIPAHQFSYELLVGPTPRPEEGELDHRLTCPKRCVNPQHLRVCTHKQNMENQSRVSNNATSGVRGVHRHRDGWQVTVKHNGRKYRGGNFRINELDKAEAAAIELRRTLFTHNDGDE